MYQDLWRKHEDDITYVYRVSINGESKLFLTWGDNLQKYCDDKLKVLEVGEHMIISVVPVPRSEIGVINM